MSLYTESLKELFENRPDLASKEQCYRCNKRIGDAAYRVTQDGCLSHESCPVCICAIGSYSASKCAIHARRK